LYVYKKYVFIYFQKLLQFFGFSILETTSKKNLVKKYTFHFLKNKTLSQTLKKSKIAVIAVNPKIPFHFVLIIWILKVALRAPDRPKVGVYENI